MMLVKKRFTSGRFLWDSRINVTGGWMKMCIYIPIVFILESEYERSNFVLFWDKCINEMGIINVGSKYCEIFRKELDLKENFAGY